MKILFFILKMFCILPGAVMVRTITAPGRMQIQRPPASATQWWQPQTLCHKHELWALIMWQRDLCNLGNKEKILNCDFNMKFKKQNRWDAHLVISTSPVSVCITWLVQSYLKNSWSHKKPNLIQTTLSIKALDQLNCRILSWKLQVLL